jgi:septum formation protein
LSAPSRTGSLVLASKSAARRAVLEGAGVPFEAVGSGVDEEAAKVELLARRATPRQVAEALAEDKALAVSTGRPELVIGADQTLEFQGQLYDKAETYEAARERLRTLRGKPHQLHSAVVVAQGGAVIWRETQTTTWPPRARRRWGRWAATGSRAWACSCSRRSRATISPSSACR